MTELDYGTFERAFQRVSGAFRIRLKPVEMNDLARTYFKVLEDFPLDEVMVAGKALLSKHRTFPKPADWRSELAHEAAAVCPPDRRVMTMSEVAVHIDAEQQHFQGNLCGCFDCVRAGIDDREIRFVPSLFGDEEERAFHPTRKRVEVVGHWAHGDELAAWYRARDHFLGHTHALGLNPARLLQVVGQSITSRDPGEEG